MSRSGPRTRSLPPPSATIPRWIGGLVILSLLGFGTLVVFFASRFGGNPRAEDSSSTISEAPGAPPESRFPRRPAPPRNFPTLQAAFPASEPSIESPREPAAVEAHAQAEAQAAHLEAVNTAVETTVPRINSEADLDQLLADLENRAKAQGKVTALEMQPAVAAIQKIFGHDPQAFLRQMNAFSETMRAISAANDPDVTHVDTIRTQ